MVYERVKDGSKFWPEQLERWRKVLFYEIVEDNKLGRGKMGQGKDREFDLGQVQFKMPIKYII